VIGVAQGGG